MKRELCTRDMSQQPTGSFVPNDHITCEGISLQHTITLSEFCPLYGASTDGPYGANNKMIFCVILFAWVRLLLLIYDQHIIMFVIYDNSMLIFADCC